MMEKKEPYFDVTWRQALMIILLFIAMVLLLGAFLVVGLRVINILEGAACLN